MAPVSQRVSDSLVKLSAAFTNDSGQGLAEYGLILGLVAVVCITAVGFFSGAVQGILSNVGSSI
jgi:pilus assembly protein Flp/PilA